MLPILLFVGTLGFITLVFYIDDRNRAKRRAEYELWKKSENAVVCFRSHTDGPMYCDFGCEHSEPHICDGNHCGEHPMAKCVSVHKFGYMFTPETAAKIPTIQDELPPTGYDKRREKFFGKEDK